MTAVKLSVAQLRALRSIRDTGQPPNVHGQAAHGGLTQTLSSLRRRELIEHTFEPLSGARKRHVGYRLTEAGLMVLKEFSSPIGEGKLR